MSYSDIRILKNQINNVRAMYTPDPEDMLAAINNLADICQNLILLVEEHDMSMEDIEPGIAEEVSTIKTEVDQLWSIADAKQGARGPKGDKGLPGSKGDPGPPGEEGKVLEHPDVKEALERIKDLEEQVDDLTEAIKELEG